jgi:hypothetical protein
MKIADPGAAYVFQRQQGGANHWGTGAQMTTSDARGAEDGFGGSVAASGDVVVIGAANNDGAANNAGAVYVSSVTWAEGIAGVRRRPCTPRMLRHRMGSAAPSRSPGM